MDPPETLTPLRCIVSCAMGAVVAWMVHRACIHSGCQVIDIRDVRENQTFRNGDTCIRYRRRAPAAR
jgi:hypothetical protein